MKVTDRSQVSKGDTVWVFPTWWFNFETATVSVVGRKHVHIDLISGAGVKRRVVNVVVGDSMALFTTARAAYREKIRRMRRREQTLLRCLENSKIDLAKLRKEIALAIHEAERP